MSINTTENWIEINKIIDLSLSRIMFASRKNILLSFIFDSQGHPKLIRTEAISCRIRFIERH